MSRRAPTHPYVYRCEDDSVVAAWISRVLAPPIQRRIPDGVTANHVTVIGSLVLWAAVVAMLATPPAARPMMAPVGLALMWIYCVLDHVDGLHARFLRSSSPLGEYLDHALDAWNVGGVIALVGAVAGAGAAPVAIAATLAGGGLAAAATWIEQRERGAIYLGRIGPVEGVVVAGVFLGSWMIPAAASWWSAPVEAGFTRVNIALFVAALGSFISALASARRTKQLRGRFAVLFVQIAVLMAAAILQWVSWPAVWFVTVAVTAIYSGRMILSHLAQTPAPWPDCVGLPALVLCGLGSHRGMFATDWEWIPLAWLAVAECVAFLQAWRRFGHHWRPPVTAPSAAIVAPIGGERGRPAVDA